MERNVFWCLDCHGIFYDGENCRCKKVDKSSFLSKLGIGNKHAEGIHGSISYVSQNNTISQIQGLNYPADFSSSTNDESHSNAEYLQNFIYDANTYMEGQQEEHPDIPVIKSSHQNTIFDLPLHTRLLASLKANKENSLASDRLVGEQYHTSDTRQETTNYSTVPVVSTTARELQNDSSDSSITKSMVHNYVIKPVLYEQDGLQDSNFSVETSSEEYCATTGLNNRDLLLNNDFFKPESHENMNERNILRSTNILESNCISKNFDFNLVQRREDKTDSLNLQRSTQVISEICDTELAHNDVSLVSESDEHPIAGPSHGNGEDYFELRDGYFICRLCGTSCNSYAIFVIHYRIHSGERPYACDKCPKRFTQQGNLTRHLRNHSEERPYPCDMCEEKFFSQVQLDIHHRLCHSAERHYACDKCPKRFTTQYHLTVHRRTHSGERPYPCDMCDKRFAQKNQLDRHRKTHFRH